MAEKFQNQLDTVIVGVPVDECKLLRDIPPTKKILGAEYKKTKEKVPKYCKFGIPPEPRDIFVFTFSSKLFATSDDIGEISLKNVQYLAPIIRDVFGIYIDPDYLYEKALLYRVDPKKDLITESQPNYTISDLRRFFKRDTSKYEIHNYEDTTYSHGLALTPKSKANRRFVIYNKGREMCLKRNKEIRERFTYEYLDKVNHMLRCELQLRKYSDIKKAFHIPYKIPQTFKTVLECPYDVVYEQFFKLMKGVVDEY